MFPYYEIIVKRGPRQPLVIGVTTDRESVLAEEPDATFAEISREQYEQL